MLVDTAASPQDQAPASALSGEPAARLLAWYDRHRRALPWRAGPGEAADPYRVWLSEIMLQQTTVAAVKPYFATFTKAWPDVAALAAARDEDILAAWAGLGYYARARNLIACARAIVARHDGRFPASEAALRALPGIGAYTAAAIAAIAFGQRAVVVDANVERVIARYLAIEAPLPAARGAIRAGTDALTPAARAGDFAQAMMDLGATLCTPRAPACALCPMTAECAARRLGRAEDYPRKPAKAAKPLRHATIFWLERGDHVLLVRRPPAGLLGGMRALPSGPWAERTPGLAGAPAEAAWRIAGHGRHVFTHFTLDYAVAAGRIAEEVDGEWWPATQIASAGLPTLFARAAAIAAAERIAA